MAVIKFIVRLGLFFSYDVAFHTGVYFQQKVKPQEDSSSYYQRKL